MTFADLEQRTNAVVFDRLSNATATIGGVPGIAVIFDNHYADFDRMAGSRPVLQVLEASVPGVANGTSVTIGADVYEVSGKPQSDGAGVMKLILELA